MMLEWLSDKYGDKNLMVEGRRIEDSIVSMLKKDKKTKDIGGALHNRICSTCRKRDVLASLFALIRIVKTLTPTDRQLSN